MATTTTAKVAEAISLLSDVLSAEVAAQQHFLDEDETEEETVAIEDHEELKNLANDFAGENYDGLEEVQSDLQSAIGHDDDSANQYWSYDEEDEDEEDDDEAPDDPGNGDVHVPATDDTATAGSDDESEPTDEEKIKSLMKAGEELQDQIDEHEQTIEDLKTSIRSALDTVNDLVTAAETFRDQVEEY